MAESPSELRAEIEKLERKQSENPEGRYFVPLANDYRKLGDLDRAESLLREGLRRHPDYLSAHIVLGRCLADRHATDEATEEFRYVLSMDPQNLIALRTLGELALESGKRDEAARWYRELLAVDPMNEEARRALESLESAGAAPAGMDDSEQWWEPTAAAGLETSDEEQPAGTAEPGDVTESEQSFGGWGEETAGFGVESAAAGDGFESAAGEEMDFGGGRFIDLDDGDGGAVGPMGGAGEEDEEDIGPVEVVTETIADLYARQGLHDRAASVYRELIRRRGGDAGLEAKLAELEQSAAGVSEGEAEEAAPAPPAEPTAAPGDDLLAAPEGLERGGEMGDLELEGDRGWDFGGDLELTGADASLGGEENGGDAEEDPFAASFAGGFGGDAEGLGADAEAAEKPAAEAETDRQTTQETEPAEALWSPTASTPATISELLGELAAWRPGQVGQAAAESGVETGAGAGVPAGDLADTGWDPMSEASWETTTAEPEREEAEETHDETRDETRREAEPAETWPETPAADPGSEAQEDEPWAGTPESTSGAESSEAAAQPEADAEPFPWEIESSEEEAPAGAAETAEPRTGPEPESEPESEPKIELDDYFSSAEPPAPTAEPEAAAPAEEPASEGAAEDEDDLESFQAWLRSLKR